MLFSVLADEIFLLRPCPEAVVPLTLRAPLLLIQEDSELLRQRQRRRARALRRLCLLGNRCLLLHP